MHETKEDLLTLQALLDHSIEQAGAFLRASFQMPDHSLSARQLVNLWQGLHTIAFATVSAQGEPRVAPISALLFRGNFYIPTVATAARTRHVMRQPAVSFTYFQGNDLAIIAHGTATIIRPDHLDFAALEALQRESSGQSVQEWGEGVFLQITPAVLYTFARQPEVYTTE
ncbi:MAG: pyridoxamine 5'-phosphate oxidase family protein [Ktedonobacteraceae bacterium]|nr:pyridoxamine 5'-phosphate oxidase family protein [Chloroflexota bacterium]